MNSEEYEKLGVFYLGRECDPQGNEGSVYLYDSRHLLTHGVCIGMTGSGKTGLCISILEEAAIDGVPVIAIDPKGDITNIALQFPNLSPAEFEPWVDPEHARRQNIAVSELAAQEAERWRRGLEQWGQDAQRIGKLQSACDVRIFTPGSRSGTPVSILHSLEAPPQEVLDERDLFQEKVAGAATSLLTLIGVDADPLQSREHILLSNIFANAWNQGRSLTLADLIAAIQKPAFTTIGALPLDNFFPAADRFKLATALNNLLASPGFEVWLEGAKLDPASFLYNAQGKPNISIFSIAHLSDTERMFFTTLLLEEVLSWMRQQSGTSSLRAILYMDELFGFLPPVANPPTKKPLLTLLKQARAYGLGLMLATQNPVDLDYKALSNIGTWFIGRLQTERDKMRVLDGLQGAAATTGSDFDRAGMDTVLSGLGNRIFLVNDVHAGEPQLIKTRQAMSYLRGPLTRQQLRKLSENSSSATAASTAQTIDQSAPTRITEPVTSRTTETVAPTAATTGISNPQKPLLPSEIKEFFCPPPKQGSQYVPKVACFVSIRFTDTKLGIDQSLDTAVVGTLSDDGLSMNWSTDEALPCKREDLLPAAPQNAVFAQLPTAFSQARNFSKWNKELIATLANAAHIDVFKCADLDFCSKPGESERDFRIRLAQRAREQRDADADRLRQKYRTRVQSAEDRLQRELASLEKENWTFSKRKWILPSTSVPHWLAPSSADAAPGRSLLRLAA